MSTIILNAEASGRAPFMDMRNPSLVLSPAAESMNMETEYTSGSRGNLFDVSAAKFPDGWPVGPGRDMPALVERSAPEFSQVDLNEWHTQYMACMRYFVDESQHTRSVKARAAFLNIRLPCQRVPEPIVRFAAEECGQESNVSLRPYIRRLIITGQDTQSVLQDFFGYAWLAGVGCIWEQERLNYLFTAKSGGWASTKAAYDILPDEHVPFLRPIREPTEEELRIAESRWSEWLAMEDWMVGSRSPW